VITEADIERLAELSRIAVTPDEAASLAKDVGAILGFVATAKAAAGEAPEGQDYGFAPVDALRPDAGAAIAPASRESLLGEAPSTQGGFVKVQKVLGGPSNA
jgi:aspartyl-tRNA(Asn)/glutamyl-tRNA(Gln) amidotransferase subunit C